VLSLPDLHHNNKKEETMMSKALKICMFFISCMGLIICSTAYAASYDHEITVQKMKFAWKVDGANLNIKLSAPTKGWVGIGFNPSHEMKDAKFVLGYVKDGKTTLSDEFGTGDSKHESVEDLGGKSDVTLVGGIEEGGITTLEFTLPLVAKDTKGGKIDPATDTVVLLGYGPDTTSFKIKHKFRTKLTVNLTTGTNK
jgi:hypothetical protein